uniref:Serine/threonine-protein kinase n=1 Tax=Rhizophora mucronata TaxID=61149 RepID=A0A2P2L0K1_RHIMU
MTTRLFVSRSVALCHYELTVFYFIFFTALCTVSSSLCFVQVVDFNCFWHLTHILFRDADACCQCMYLFLL